MKPTPVKRLIGYMSAVAVSLLFSGCMAENSVEHEPVAGLQPDFSVPDTATHSRFSSKIAPVIRVPSGSIVELFTQEATGGQLTRHSDEDDLLAIDFDRVHTMTGPIFVEGAEPGDSLAIELLELDVADWGWMALLPGFGQLADEITSTSLRTFEIDKASGTVKFADGIILPLKPFPGILGVAPASPDMINTFPPRANGGNIDNPAFTKGTTVYLPVFTEGALFSIGDTHALQGFGEVSGTALEAPMRVVVRLSVIKNGRTIHEPQYETENYYATTGFATTLDEAAKKATRYMIDYLMEEKGLSRDDAYLLCSLVGDLLIAETVDFPHMLVTMHMPKAIFVKD